LQSGREMGNVTGDRLLDEDRALWTCE